MNAETESEVGQDPKSYAAKPRSLKSVLKSMFPLRTFGFSKQARQARKEANDEFWSEFMSLSGRSSRSEFWWTVGACLLVSFAITGLSIIFDDRYSLPPMLMAAAAFWGSIPVTVRRFHDMGNSGWWTVIVIGPLVAFDILSILKTDAMEKYERAHKMANVLPGWTQQPQMPWVMPDEALGILAIIAFVCLIVGYIVLSRKGTPEKTRFDKDD